MSRREGASGYFEFEANDLGEAVELAARIPAARHGGVTVIRPVAVYW